MAIEITPEVEHLVHGIYAGGHYSSESDVLAAAVRLLNRQEQLRQDLAQGCQELDAGERLDADVVFLELRERAAKLDSSSS